MNDPREGINNKMGPSTFLRMFSLLLKELNSYLINDLCDLMIMMTACLVFNPIMVEGYAALFSCTLVIQASDSMKTST